MEDFEKNRVASDINYLDWYFNPENRHVDGMIDMQAIKSWGVVKELIKIMRDRLCDDGK